MGRLKVVHLHERKPNYLTKDDDLINQLGEWYVNRDVAAVRKVFNVRIDENMFVYYTFSQFVDFMCSKATEDIIAR